MHDPIPASAVDASTGRHRTDQYPSVKVIADDLVSVHVYQLSALPAEWVKLLSTQPPPPHPELLPPQQIGHAQRVPDGYVVWSVSDSGVLYPQHDYGRVICSVLDFTG